MRNESQLALASPRHWRESASRSEFRERNDAPRGNRMSSPQGKDYHTRKQNDKPAVA